jgi:hypothetical protein
VANQCHGLTLASQGKATLPHSSVCSDSNPTLCCLHLLAKAFELLVKAAAAARQWPRCYRAMTHTVCLPSSHTGSGCLSVTPVFHCPARPVSSWGWNQSPLCFCVPAMSPAYVAAAHLRSRRPSYPLGQAGLFSLCYRCHVEFFQTMLKF